MRSRLAASGRAIGVVAITWVLVWGSIATMLAPGAPPGAPTWNWSLVVIMLPASAGWTVLGWRHAGLRRALCRAPMTLVAGVGAGLAAMQVLFSRSGLLLIVYLIGVPILFVVGLVALFRIRRATGDALGTLLVIGLSAFLITNGVGLEDVTFRARLRLVEDDLRSDAESVLARPAEPAGPSGEPFRAEAEDGSSVVAWVMAHGIPFRAWGLVYDPDDVLGSDAVFESQGYPYSFRAWRCEHIDGPWYWCRLT